MEGDAPKDPDAPTAGAGAATPSQEADEASAAEATDGPAAPPVGPPAPDADLIEFLPASRTEPPAEDGPLVDFVPAPPPEPLPPAPVATPPSAAAPAPTALPPASPPRLPPLPPLPPPPPPHARRPGRRGGAVVGALLAVAALALLAAAWPLLAPDPADAPRDAQEAEGVDGLAGVASAAPSAPPPRTTAAAPPTPTPSPSTSAEPVPGGPERRDLSTDYAAPSDPSAYVHRVYTWPYGGVEWALRMDLPLDAYAAYRETERPSRMLVLPDGLLLRQQAYDVFVTDPADDAFVDALAHRLDAAAAAEGYDREERLGFLLAFVQSMPYTSDNVTTGFDEYARFPLETLVDDGGDCEDTSILYASLLGSLGEDAILLAPPEHMAVGVALAAGDGGEGTGGDGAAPGTYVHNGTAYRYAETTGRGWLLGDVPEVYAGAPVETFDLVPKPLFHLDVDFGAAQGGRQQVTMQATQTGSGVSLGVRLVAELRPESGPHYDQEQCAWGGVEPGLTVTCTVWLDLRLVPQGQAAQVVLAVYDDEHLYDRVRSVTWVPWPAPVPSSTAPA